MKEIAFNYLIFSNLMFSDVTWNVFMKMKKENNKNNKKTPNVAIINI